MVAQANATQFSTPNDTDIVMTRTFAAPAALVYEASTKPEHIVRWWGPRAYTTEVVEMDVRVGGHYRFIHRAADGTGYVFSGVYIALEPVTRIVQTQVFEGVAGAPDSERLHQEMLVTTTLEETDGQTRLTSTCRLNSKQERDGLMSSGMTDGAAESMDRLAELLAKLA